MRRDIKNYYRDDREDLNAQISSRWVKKANPPVLDGLFGGKACYRSWADKSKLNIILSE